MRIILLRLPPLDLPLVLPPHSNTPIIPELNVPFFAQGALLDLLPALAEDIFDVDLGVAEDLEIIRDDVAVAAARASHEDCAVVIALLGDLVARARRAGLACEDELVGRGLPAGGWGLGGAG